MRHWFLNLDYVILIRNAWRLAAGRRHILVVLWILQLGANGFILTQPILIGEIVKVVAEGGDQLFPHLIFWLVVLVACVCGFFSLQVPSRFLERRMAFHLRKTQVSELYREVTALPWAWHQNHHSGNMLNRIKLATDGTFQFIDWHFEFLGINVRLIGSVGFLFWVSPLAGTLIGIAVPAMIMLLRYFNATLLTTSTAQNEAENEASAGLYDYIGNIATLLTLRLQEPSHREIMRRLGIVQGWFHRYIMTNEIKWALFTILLEIVGALAMLIYIWQHRVLALPVVAGTVVTIFQYLRQIIQSIRVFADKQQDMMKWRIANDGAKEIRQAYQALGKDAAPFVKPDWQSAVIQDLRFRYEDQQRHMHHLDGVTLNLMRGRRIALVGTSGSGKSTLLRLMQGLHVPEAGEVLIDGAPAGFPALAALSTLVPQDAEIFENTLRYNITCGVDEDVDIEPVIRMACLDSVIVPLEQGIETDIREKGVNLSGGQKQRLALARGLYAARSSSLLLLDEPTSSLDPSTEALVFERILAAKKDSCLVASIHRLHLLDRFDYIYVLEDGKVVEEGTLPDLLGREGRLKIMWDVQISDERYQMSDN